MDIPPLNSHANFDNFSPSEVVEETRSYVDIFAKVPSQDSSRTLKPLSGRVTHSKDPRDLVKVFKLCTQA